MFKINVPLTVPRQNNHEYKKNYSLLTNKTGRLLLIAGDQKVEHLNDDFFGSDISKDDASPEHLFKIAAASNGGALATHLGLVSRYGGAHKDVPYIIKLNGKTNIGPSEEKNSSQLWWSVDDVLKFKKQSGLKIVGIGYTLYLGGRYEAKMLMEAARAIFEAHQAGLTAILWVYPRSKGINEENIHTIAGGAGIAASLDADFAKVKYPYKTKNLILAARNFYEATLAAGQTKIICVGGEKRSTDDLFKCLEKQIKISGTAGLAIGRNLHQRPLDEATRLSQALGSIIFHNKTAEEAKLIFSSKKKETKKSSKFFSFF